MEHVAQVAGLDREVGTTVLQQLRQADKLCVAKGDLADAPPRAMLEAWLRVFVDGAKTPSLVVDRLSSDRKKRAMGLFVDSADGYYANLTVTPETVGLAQ